MARRQRIDLPGLTHHVTNRGVDRQRIFFDDGDRVAFGRALDLAHQKFGITLDAYCLMDNHFHLIIHCPDAVLSRSMQLISSRFAQQTNRRQNRDGHLFGARFFSAPITTDSYRFGCQRYVERNCLDLPGITSPVDYRWSSLRSHLGYRRGPEWLDSERVLSGFGSSDSYRRFICDEPTASGDRDLDFEQLFGMVGSMIRIHAEQGHSRNNLARTVLALLAERSAESQRRIIIDGLGFASQKSTRSSLRRALQRASTDPSIWLIVEAVESWRLDRRTTGNQAA